MDRRLLAVLPVIAIGLWLPRAAEARAVEFYVGGGGGYEWFDMSALDYNDLLSLETINASGDTITYNPPIQKYKGSSGIFDVYAGIKLLTFVLAVDYRASYLAENIGFSQLSAEFMFQIPVKKVIPFIRIGAGYVWMAAKIDPPPPFEADNLRARGLVARAGVGLDFRLIKFLSFGVGVDVGFLYFTNSHGKSWGMTTDLQGRLTLHI